MGCCCLFDAAATPQGKLSPPPPEVTFPLHGKVSSFNSAYNCEVLSVTVSHDALTLSLAVRGDGSRGPLQAPSDSLLLAGGGEWPPVATRPADGCTPNVWNGTLSFSRRGWCGVPLKRGTSVSFKFGESGYREVELFTLSDSFLQATPGLGDLLL
jgi:hypothetical protein